MKNRSRLSVLFLSLISLPCLISSNLAFAQDHLIDKWYYSGYDDGYDDGYEDGYDDAMEDCPCPPMGYGLRSGFYVGAGLGYDGFQIERKPWVENESIGSLNTHANGGNAKLFGGYGKFFDRYYIGGEIFLGTSGAKGTDNINTPGLQYNGKFSVGTSYGISVLPGYKLGSTLAYGRLGYVQTELEARDSSGTFSNNSTNWTSGYNLGLGVEMPVYKGLSARFAYDYFNYNNFNTKGTTGSCNAAYDNRGSIDLLYRIPF